MAKKKQHGGKRRGAGRKIESPEGAVVTIAASVPSGLVDQLDLVAAKNGLSRSRAVTEAIRGYVAATKRG